MAFTPCLEGSEVGEKEAAGLNIQRLLFYPMTSENDRFRMS